MAKERIKPLPDVIRDMGGPEAFATRYDCTVRAARAYMNRERKPRPDSDLTQRLIADRVTTWEGIYSS